MMVAKKKKKLRFRILLRDSEVTPYYFSSNKKQSSSSEEREGSKEVQESKGKGIFLIGGQTGEDYLPYVTDGLPATEGAFLHVYVWGTKLVRCCSAVKNLCLFAMMNSQSLIGGTKCNYANHPIPVSCCVSNWRSEKMKWRLFIIISRESKWGTPKSAGNPRCAVPAESHSICTDRRRPGPAAALQVSPTSDTCQSVAILMSRCHYWWWRDCVFKKRAVNIISKIPL